MSEQLRNAMRRYQYPLVLVLILALATWLRLHQLATLPPGLHPDEAANGLDALRILEQHDWQPFYSGNGGREGLLFYFQALGIALFGNTIVGLRIAPALFGVAAVAAVYAWAASWFTKRTALIAAFIMAVTPWAITISRDGFRAGLVAVAVPLTLWFATKAFKSGQWGWYVAAGLSTSLGLYTYTSFRIFPLLLGILALIAFMRFRERTSVNGRFIGVAIGAGFVALIPLAWYALHHPGEVFGRSAGVSVLNSELNHGQPFVALAQSVIKTLAMFNLHGDNNFRHNLGGQPELNLFIGLMFVLGIIICITAIRHLRFASLLLIFFGMLIPAMVTAEGMPHGLRAIGALPAATVLAALGISYMLDQWHAVFPLNGMIRASGSVALFALLALTGYQGYTQYFVAWANAPQTYSAFSEDSVALARYYNGHPSGATYYTLASEYQMNPVAYLTHKHMRYQHITPTDIRTLTASKAAMEFSMLESNKPQALPVLQAAFPAGRLMPHYSAFDGRELFVTYQVPAS